MASKVHTDNPKHHAYVSVNKRERKKVKRVGAKLPLLTLLAKEILYLFEHRPCGWRNYGYSYIPRGSVIIWDDCNHKTYRRIKKVGRFWQYGAPRHLKKTCGYFY